MSPNALRYRCWAEIDLAALERNLGRIKATLPPHIRYVAVVKADAYGHGQQALVSRLMQCGADAFAVANVHEGAAIREIGSGWPILVLSAVLPEETPLLLEYDLIATLSTPEEAHRLEALGKHAGRPLPVHLKVDTGMGRLGVWHEQAPELYSLLRQLPHLELQGIYTHFSCADSNTSFTREQRTLFVSLLERLPGLDRTHLLIHADNSAGLESFSPDSPFNAVRVGLLQFGLLPAPGSILATLRPEPVLSFHTRVGIVKDLPAGTAISYNRTHVLSRPTRVAVLTAGYGDGIPTQCSNKAQVLIHGQRCPVLGRVTMDQTIVDIAHLPQTRPGDPVVLIGHQEGASISVAEFSQWSDSIPWEVFCSLTKRVPRLYKTDRSL